MASLPCQPKQCYEPVGCHTYHLAKVIKHSKTAIILYNRDETILQHIDILQHLLLQYNTI